MEGVGSRPVVGRVSRVGKREFAVRGQDSVTLQSGRGSVEPRVAGGRGDWRGSRGSRA